MQAVFKNDEKQMAQWAANALPVDVPDRNTLEKAWKHIGASAANDHARTVEGRFAELRQRWIDRLLLPKLANLSDADPILLTLPADGNVIIKAVTYLTTVGNCRSVLRNYHAWLEQLAHSREQVAQRLLGQTKTTGGGSVPPRTNYGTTRRSEARRSDNVARMDASTIHAAVHSTTVGTSNKDKTIPGEQDATQRIDEAPRIDGAARMDHISTGRAKDAHDAAATAAAVITRKDERIGHLERECKRLEVLALKVARRIEPDLNHGRESTMFVRVHPQDQIGTLSDGTLVIRIAKPTAPPLQATFDEWHRTKWNAKRLAELTLPSADLPKMRAFPTSGDSSAVAHWLDELLAAMTLTRHDRLLSKTPEEWAAETKGEIGLHTCQVFDNAVRQFVLNLMGRGNCPSMLLYKTTKPVIEHIRVMYRLDRERGAAKRNRYW
ncbi:hypothetical protein GGF32_007669 [Allomyces javanicus]|nr:hypothetical protein GGF32_007669 [Allomyces javanicus]